MRNETEAAAWSASRVGETRRRGTAKPESPAVSAPVVDTGLDDGFVSRTYPSVAVMAGAAALFAWRWGVEWASVPVLVGAGLGLALLFGAQKGMAQWGLMGAGGGAKRGLYAFAWFTVIKCLLAWGLLWWVARTWDLRQIAALGAGISLIATNITLRAIGRLLAGPQNLKRGET